MFKVEKPEHINKTFRMPKELMEQLGEVAQNKGVSVNQLIIQCCRYSLAELDKSDKPQTSK